MRSDKPKLGRSELNEWLLEETHRAEVKISTREGDIQETILLGYEDQVPNIIHELTEDLQFVEVETTYPRMSVGEYEMRISGAYILDDCDPDRFSDDNTIAMEISIIGEYDHSKALTRDAAEYAREEFKTAEENYRTRKVC